MPSGSAPVEHRLTVERSARVYTLGSVQASDAWIVLHGYGQLAARFIANFAGVAGQERVVVAPEALNRFYLEFPRRSVPASERRVGTTWMTREDREAEIADYVAYLDLVVTRVVPSARSVTALGFSQGVATACRWAALGSSTIRRLILWSGQVPPDLDHQRLAQRLSGAPVDLVLGDKDPIVDTATLEKELARLREAGIEIRLTRFDGAHTIDAAVLDTLARTA